MEEISIKSNFRFKALVAALIAVIVTTTCTTAFGWGMSDIGKLFGKDEKDPFFNRVVYFTGETKVFKDGNQTWKTFTEENPGSGKILMVSGNSFYIAGKGWIDRGQIIDDLTRRLFTFEINPLNTKEGKGLNAYVLLDGEHLNIESDNNAIVSYEGGVLKANAKGATEVNVHNTKTGEDIKIAAVVVGSDQPTEELRDEEGRLDADAIKGDGLSLQLSIEEKMLSADLDKATIGIANDKFVVDATGHAEIGIGIDEEGKFNVKAAGEGEAVLKVKTNEVAEEVEPEYDEDGELIESAAPVSSYKEIARINVKGDVTATVDLAKQDFTISGNAEERLTILDKFAVALQERASANVNLETQTAKATAGGSVLAGQAGEEELKEIAGADGSISYKYGDTDPKGAAEARILGYQIGSLENEQPIPISKLVAGMQSLVSRVR